MVLFLPLETIIVKPIIKWAGGKRQLLPQLTALIPQNFGTYFEPFVGGGALWLDLEPRKAVINDYNEFLSLMYQVIKDTPQDLIELLKIHKAKNSKEYYLSIRAQDRNGILEQLSPVQKVARFMYLNKTGYNGLWRVNKKNQNNVPYGIYKNPKINNADEIMELHKYLVSNSIQILNGDYKDSLKYAQKNDLVYFDPPYVPMNTTASFTAYTDSGFTWDDQVELRDIFMNLTQRGVYVMYSNHDLPVVRELFKKLPSTQLHHVEAKRNINSKANKRGNVGELIITNY